MDGKRANVGRENERDVKELDRKNTKRSMQRLPEKEEGKECRGKEGMENIMSALWEEMKETKEMVERSMEGMKDCTREMRDEIEGLKRGTKEREERWDKEKKELWGKIAQQQSKVDKRDKEMEGLKRIEMRLGTLEEKTEEIDKNRGREDEGKF